MSHATATFSISTERLATGLSTVLRAETRAAHAAAEKRFVRAAKAVPGSGPHLLMGLNLGLVSWLDRAAHILPFGRLRNETGVFVAAVLEAHASPVHASSVHASAAHAPAADGAPARPTLADPAFSEPAEVVGAAYAICGSTLGASVLADAWRDETDARWVRFCAASRALERRWPLFAAALDDWGDAHAVTAYRRVFMGANRAFAHAGALVDALSRSR